MAHWAEKTYEQKNNDILKRAEWENASKWEPIEGTDGMLEQLTLAMDDVRVITHG